MRYVPNLNAALQVFKLPPLIRDVASAAAALVLAFAGGYYASAGGGINPSSKQAQTSASVDIGKASSSLPAMEEDVLDGAIVESVARLDNALDWMALPERMRVLRSAVVKIAETKGSKGAIAHVCEMVKEGELAAFPAHLAVEIATLAALQGAEVRSDELEELLRGFPEFAAPLMSGMSYSAPKKKLGDVYAFLRDLSTHAGVKLDKALEGVIVASSVQAAEWKSTEDLVQFRKVVENTSSERKLLLTIAAVAAAFEKDAAFAFLKTIPVDGADLAEIVFTSDISIERVTAVLRQTEVNKRSHILESFTSRLGDISPQLLSELASLIKPEEFSLNGRAIMMAGLVKSDTNSAVDWIERIPVAERGGVLADALNSMLSGQQSTTWDYRFAKNWLAAASKGSVTDTALLKRAIQDAARDVPTSTALAFVDLAPVEERAMLTRYVLSQAIYRNAGILSAHELLSIADRGPAEARDELMNVVVQAAARIPDRSTELLASDLPETVKQQLKIAMLTAGSESGLTIAERKKHLSDLVGDPAFSAQPQQAVDALLTDLISTNPNDALLLISKLPPSPMKTAAVTNLANQWSRTDPVSASEWIVELPPGPDRDGALANLVRSSRDDPWAGLANAAAIADEKLRMQAAQSIVNYWKVHDPTGTAELIGSSGLPHRDKQILLELLSKRLE